MDSNSLSEVTAGNLSETITGNLSDVTTSNFTDATEGNLSQVTQETTVPVTVTDIYRFITELSTYNATESDPQGEDNCDISTKYGIVSSSVAVIFIMFGILYTFLGYRFFKAIMFLTGFIFGSVLVYMVLEEYKLLPSEGRLGAGVGFGVLLGLLTMLILHTGLFLTGFNLGVALAGLILVLVEQFIAPSSKWIPISVLIALGFIFGLLGLRFQKGMMIISMSVIGGALALAGGDYFLEQSRMSLYFWDRAMAYKSSPPCWYSWVMLAAWPCLALAGTIVQWKCTGVGVDHKVALFGTRDQAVNLQQERARERRETQQTRYRHLYQARRVKGDVVSQNFIQSIQHKLSPAMQSLTALNVEASNEDDSTATTTLTHVT